MAQQVPQIMLLLELTPMPQVCTSLTLTSARILGCLTG